MQATINTRYPRFHRTTLTLAAVGLLAIAISGIIAIAIGTDSTDSGASHASTSVTAPMPAWRFAEINALPGAATRLDQPSANWRFLEINALPVAPAVTPVGFERQRFVEINQLPVDNALLVAPEMVTGTRS